VGTALGYGVPGLLVAVLIGALISVQANAEAAVSDFAGALPIGFAAAAGVVASVNPCGFFMLPGYVAYQLGTQEAGYDQLSASRRVARALAVGLMATLGFVLIFAAVGAVIAAGGTFLSRVFPFLGLSVGVLMVIFGAYLLITHRYIGVLAASRIQVTPQRNLGNAFVFGLGYAVGSLSCTLPIFLVLPTRPPRNRDDQVDTLLDRGIDLEHRMLVKLYNPIAAMPSHHVAFAVVTGFGMARFALHPLMRAVGVVYPAAVATVVVATGNHYTLDVIAGAALGVVARIVTR